MAAIRAELDQLGDFLVRLSLKPKPRIQNMLIDFADMASYQGILESYQTVEIEPLELEFFVPAVLPVMFGDLPVLRDSIFRHFDGDTEIVLIKDLPFWRDMRVGTNPNPGKAGQNRHGVKYRIGSV